MLTVITSVRGSVSSISAIVPLVVGERHGLAADREVAPLRPADVVIWKQDPRQIGMPPKHDAEEVIDLPLLELGSRKKLTARVDFGKWLSLIPVPLRVAWGGGGGGGGGRALVSPPPPPPPPPQRQAPQPDRPAAP